MKLKENEQAYKFYFCDNSQRCLYEKRQGDSQLNFDTPRTNSEQHLIVPYCSFVQATIRPQYHTSLRNQRLFHIINLQIQNRECVTWTISIPDSESRTPQTTDSVTSTVQYNTVVAIITVGSRSRIVD